jgi:exonuclease SbcC
VQALRQQVEARDRLRERGGSLRARIEQQQQQLGLHDEELARCREKIHIFQASSAARCPLCGSRLDGPHRRRLAQELARQEREQAALLEEQRRALEQLEAELQILREQYQTLEEEIAPLEDLQKELAELGARRAQLEELEAQRPQLEAQLAELGLKIESRQYAVDQQRELQKAEEELARLAYQPDQHTSVRNSLQELLPIEAKHARLQDARIQADKLRSELEEAREKQALAQQYLDDALYAQSEQRELRACADQLEQLGYDPGAHQELRRRIDALSDVVARRERLLAARQRHASSEEVIARNEAELGEMKQRRQELDRQCQNLRHRGRELEDVERRFAELATRLNQARASRDQFLQQQGSLQAQCARCVKLAEERDEIQARLEECRREGWIYQQLNDAFGKDGIQALIIENAIPEIEREANALLSRLTDNRIQISIESLRDLKKGGTRETLDIKIADEVGERSYHLYSGGEAFRTNFALRVALSRVLALRAGTRLRTLIIDEGFGTQDSQGLEQLIEAIQEISRDFDKVLVVTHLPALKNAFPVQIEVTKHPDVGSRFQVVRNG